MAIIGERWEVYEAMESEDRLVISFDRDAAEERRHEGFDAARRVVIRPPAEWVRDNGMPAPQAAVPLRLSEDSLIRLLEESRIPCRLVARLTYSGIREFLFQVEGAHDFDQIFELWRLTQRWPVSLLKADGWEHFDDNVTPTPAEWLQIRNNGVIQSLRDAGTDAAQPHILEHSFHGPAAALEALRPKLIADGFRAKEPISNAPAIFTKESVLDLFAITGTTMALEMLAREHGAAYDGWSAAVIPLPGCP